jgi:hypothetical protein
MIGESMQQLLIAFLAAALRGDHVAKMPDAGGQCGTAHDGGPKVGKYHPFLIVPARRDSSAGILTAAVSSTTTLLV